VVSCGFLKKNVSIIGAGTAGLIAAKTLASYGVETRVYDQKHVLGYPARASGILSINGLESLGIGYKRAITNRLFGANLHAGRKTLKVRSKNPIAYVLDRKDLNGICHDEAVDAGANVELGRRISGEMLDGIARSDIVIGADGAVSAVAKHFSMGSINDMVLTYKAEYNVDMADKELVDLFFDNNSYRGLFAWTCPNANDILEVGVGVSSRFGNSKKAFEKFARSEAVMDMIGNTKPIDEGASIIPIGMRERIVDPEKEVILVGDAAGQVKATTGGGIIFGGKAAMIAGSVIKGYLESKNGLDDYRKLFVKRYGFDMGMHRAIGSFYKSFGTKHVEMAFGLLDSLGISSFLAKYGDMDMPSIMLKRLFLRGLAD
jgi:digeranylgeranylglycerophospholipid reductase